MAKKNRNFIQETIKAMTKEEFDELVRIFQTSYFKYDEVVNVDGANDGGCDIKIFKNKREIKKCVQITIQKLIDKKIKDDLLKVSEMITKYNYSPNFDFICSCHVSEEKIAKLKKYAIDLYDINLEIYEANRIAQFDCKEVVDYIYSLHSNVVYKPEEIDIDKTTKVFYDLLANGKDTTDIKNSFVDSVIISILYKNGPLEMHKIQEELEKEIGKNFPDILHSINRLKTSHQVESDEMNKRLLKLSADEFDNVKDIFANSGKMETDFKTDLTSILSKYNIEYREDIFNRLVQLYKNNYSNDLDLEETSEKEIDNSRLFEDFKKYLSSISPNKSQLDALINEIRNLCASNNYVNRITASESFLSLYKSNKLEQYLNRKHKDIYLDTPAFVYLLCSMYGVGNDDWDNPYYRSMKSLDALRDSHSDRISFLISQDYLGEVAGEIKKAIQISQFEKFGFFEDLGGTRNTIFNYYSYLKKNDLFDFDDKISSFTDFIATLGFDRISIYDDLFSKKAIRILNVISDDHDICRETPNHFYPRMKLDDIKTLYERILYLSNKRKTDSAVRSDIKQVLMALEHDNSTDCYLATWDTTIYHLRDHLLTEDTDSNYNYFNIYNPAKLSNKIALENFNIDESAITNDIFAYADKKYEISSRVKSVLDLIAPILSPKKDGKNKLIRQLALLRKQQLETSETDDSKMEQDKNLPIEEVLITMIPNKEKRQKDSNIMSKFTSFMSSDENADYILSVIHKMIQNPEEKQSYLVDFYNKIDESDTIE